MAQKNRIITLIDFSEYTATIMSLTNKMAEILKAKVVLVHQVSGVTPSFSEEFNRLQIIELEQKEALKRLELISAKHKINNPDFLVKNQSILRMLDELKKEGFFNLVLVGLKGTGLLKQLFIGSTAIDVIDNSRLLTMAVPIKERIFLPQKLVIAVHPKYPLNKTHLKWVLTQFLGTIKSVEFISIVTEKDEVKSYKIMLEELESKYEKFNTSTTLFKGTNVFTDIKTYMETKKDTYLVVQQGSRNFTDNLFRKFMINDLVYTASIPLIVLPK